MLRGAHSAVQHIVTGEQRTSTRSTKVVSTPPRKLFQNDSALEWLAKFVGRSLADMFAAVRVSAASKLHQVDRNTATIQKNL